MKREKTRGIVTAYARMWPRVAFELKLDREVYAETVSMLNKPGVYILYRDEHPYYIGKTNNKLFNRIRAHATNVQDTYYFWNYVSAFAVPNSAKRDELEGILIAAMPTTANGAEPKQLSKVPIPSNIKLLMEKLRQGKVVFD